MLVFMPSGNQTVGVDYLIFMKSGEGSIIRLILMNSFFTLVLSSLQKLRNALYLTLRKVFNNLKKVLFLLLRTPCRSLNGDKN